MRTTIDILNYFRRQKQRKKYRKEIMKLKQQIYDLQQDVRMYRSKQKPLKEMYNDLIDVLNNVSEHCALRPTAEIQAPYPLQRIDMQNSNYWDCANKMLEYHCVNLYTAGVLIHDYAVEECIHFELDTGDGRYRYQYSKKGLALQPIKKILKEVTQMMASAWYKKIHE